MADAMTYLAALPLWLLASLGAVFGAVIGSFWGALCLRWPKGDSIIRGRSQCDACGHGLRPRELVPILSYLLQKRRCRNCAQTIAPDHFIAELAGAGIGAVSFALISLPDAFAFLVLGLLLIPLALLDYRHFWLPNSLIMVLAIGGLLLGQWTADQASFAERLLTGFIAFMLFEGIRRLYAALRKREGMGAGDPKLVGALGLWLPAMAMPITIFVAAALGLLAAIALPKMVNSQISTGATILPLGTLLAIAAFPVALISSMGWLA